MIISTITSWAVTAQPWAFFVGQCIGWSYIPTAMMFIFVAWRDSKRESQEEIELHENVSSAQYPEISAHLVLRTEQNNMMLNKQRNVGLIVYTLLAIIFTILQITHPGSLWADAATSLGVYLSGIVVVYSAVKGRTLTYLYGALPVLFSFAAGLYLAIGTYPVAILYGLLAISMMGTYTVMVKHHKFKREVLRVLDDVHALRFARQALDNAIVEYNKITNTLGKQPTQN